MIRGREGKNGPPRFSRLIFVLPPPPLSQRRSLLFVGPAAIDRVGDGFRGDTFVCQPHPSSIFITDAT